MIKVRSDAPHTLCLSCRNASVIRNWSNALPIIKCRYFETTINMVVSECSQHDDASQPSIYEMKKTAWILDPGKKEQIGFVKPGTDQHMKLTGFRKSDYDPD